VNVRVTLRVLQDAVTIPDPAIQRGPNGLYVYVVQPDSSVVAQPVRVGQTDASKAIVEQGISPGQRVVVAGHYKLKPGVKVVEAGPVETSAVRSGAP